MEKKNYRNIDQYIAAFPKDIGERMEILRSIILEAAPGSEEVISYNMPAFKLNKVLVYFAGYKNHIGFYPTPNPIKVFEKELAKYEFSKGAIQFPHDQKLPIALIKRMVKFRVGEMKGTKKIANSS